MWDLTCDGSHWCYRGRLCATLGPNWRVPVRNSPRSRSCVYRYIPAVVMVVAVSVSIKWGRECACVMGQDLLFSSFSSGVVHENRWIVLLHCPCIHPNSSSASQFHYCPPSLNNTAVLFSQKWWAWVLIESDDLHTALVILHYSSLTEERRTGI